MNWTWKCHSALCFCISSHQFTLKIPTQQSLTEVHRNNFDEYVLNLIIILKLLYSLAVFIIKFSFLYIISILNYRKSRYYNQHPKWWSAIRNYFSKSLSLANNPKRQWFRLEKRHSKSINSPTGCSATRWSCSFFSIILRNAIVYKTSGNRNCYITLEVIDK